MDNNKTTTKKETKFNNYEGFVEKFKPKKQQMIATHLLTFMTK